MYTKILKYEVVLRFFFAVDCIPNGKIWSFTRRFEHYWRLFVVLDRINQSIEKWMESLVWLGQNNDKMTSIFQLHSMLFYFFLINVWLLYADYRANDYLFLDIYEIIWMGRKVGMSHGKAQKSFLQFLNELLVEPIHQRHENSKLIWTYHHYITTWVCYFRTKSEGACKNPSNYEERPNCNIILVGELVRTLQTSKKGQIVTLF